MEQHERNSFKKYEVEESFSNSGMKIRNRFEMNMRRTNPRKSVYILLKEPFYISLNNMGIEYEAQVE